MKKIQYVEILRDWNFWGNNTVDTGLRRKLYLNKLNQLSSLDEIIGICGVRRCGKTTLLLQLIKDLHKTKKIPLKNTLYVNFEDPRLGESLTALDLFDIIEAYQNQFKPKGKFYLFLDEIQVVKDWEKFVRTIYDQQKKVKIFVSGSSSSIFDSKLSSLLSGRIINLQVFPLNFVEFLQFKNQDKKIKSITNKLFEEFIAEYLSYGGFPRVVLEEDKIAKRQILISYYESILEQDVILKNNIKKAAVLKQLAKYVLSNISNQISTYALQKKLGISNQHIGRYLDYLEDAYLIFRIPKFAYSVKKQIYNPDKVFCVDSGLVNTAGFSFSENKGHLLENLVYLNLKQQSNDLYYWKNGTEIDFLIRKGTQIEKLVNVTTTVDDDQVWEREIKSLAIAQKEYPRANTQLVSFYNQSKRQDNSLISLKDLIYSNLRASIG